MEANVEMIEPLTPREHDVLRALSQGHPDKEIACLLRIAPGTVRLHVHRVLSKLGVENRVQAVLKAQRIGFIK